MEQVQELVLERSPFPKEETERMLAVRFDHMPQRLEAALRHWPLARAAVLDIGCGYGNCLVHFGSGSAGVDNGPEECALLRALGLNVREVDVEEPGALEGLGKFEYVWVSDMLEHLDAPRLFLRNLHPVVGRSLLLQVSVLPGITRRVMRRIGERPFDADVHYHQWTVETIQHLIRRAGHRPVRMISVLPTKARHLPLPVRWASRVIIEAVPDATLLATVLQSEARNEHRIA